ncbi:MAG: leucine--tRNA ligase [Candidatus Aminicenantes bacterium]|nr:leucine--tRNA ligase [Candidatus Aminicenantes bacterium]
MSKGHSEYDFFEIEKRWQKVWADKRAFEVREDPAKPKFYLLEMYPYPSGRIHMGHVRNYSIGDVIGRFKTMRGFNVLHPIGWDALGMPAENAAIKHSIHPQTWTLDNIAHMKAQLQRMGIAYDWSREVNTCLPEYYKWNQWIFLRLFERGLAYRKKSWVNWCPQCRTVLANEQAAGGECWRCATPVEQKKMDHWFLKITDYAEELLTGHAQLRKWPEHVLLMQKNWIGKSRGAYVDFAVPELGRPIRVFTTRIDTIFGATFLVLSPEHPLSRDLIAGDKEAKLQEWVTKTVAESRLRRDLGDAEKEGIDTGRTAINPFTGERIPIWIANYVLMEYGTGAIMAVPAHDERDFEFAQKYGLVIREVIEPEPPAADTGGDGGLFVDHGLVKNSGPWSGLRSEEAMERMAALAKDQGFGEASTTFRLRDWGISRQRYWGAPIPIIYCAKCGIQGVPDEDLPVRIPYNAEFTGEAGSPLEKVAEFVNATCPKCGGKARRETDTMDTFVDSSWYFFRYASPKEAMLPFARAAADYWMPVDLYIGGVEHAILHLIYARFFTKVLRDLGLTALDEPFPHYLAQGMVTKDGSAMSKSRGNVVDPDEIINTYGADALRLFILFAAPPEKEFAWNEDGIEGAYRFICRVRQTFEEIREMSQESAAGEDAAFDTDSAARLRKKMHQTIKKVGEDIEKRFHLNTAISSIMEFTNMLRREKDVLKGSAEGRALLREAAADLILLLSPFTPHICEEMWKALGRDGLVFHAPWPAYDPGLAREEKATVVVEINGKIRDKFETDLGIPEDEMKAIALGLPRIQELIGARPVRKVVCIQNKIVNIVL